MENLIAQKNTKPPFFDRMSNLLKPCKLVYTALISQTAKFLDHLIQKWQIELDSFEIDADTIMNSFQNYMLLLSPPRLRVSNID